MPIRHSISSVTPVLYFEMMTRLTGHLSLVTLLRMLIC